MPPRELRARWKLNGNLKDAEGISHGMGDPNESPFIQKIEDGSPKVSFLNGSFTRLLDPDATLRSKLAEFVDKGDFGLAYELSRFRQPPE